MSFVDLRRGHQQRADRLDARFSGFTPTWSGQSVTAAAQSTQDSKSPPVVLSPAPADPNAKDPHGKSVSTSVPVLVPAPVPSVSLSDVGIPTVTIQPPLPTSTAVTPPVLVPTSSLSSVVSPPVIPSSSSSTPIVHITPVVVPTHSSQTTVVFTTPSTFQNLPQSTYIPPVASTASPSATSSSSSSGMSTGSIVGIAAGSIAGVAVIGIAGIYLLKRYFTHRDEDDGPSFQRHSWMRNSVAVPDEAPMPIPRGPSSTPRPPSMIERKQTQNYSNLGRGTYPQDQGGYPLDHGRYPQDNMSMDHGRYPQDNMSMGYSGYQDSPYGAPPMSSFNPGQHIGPSASPQPFFSPIASPPLASPGVASFDESMPPMQHASFDAATGAPVYFSRRDSNMSRGQRDLSANLPDIPNPHDSVGAEGYTTLNRSSVTPYQAQQYAAISMQLSSPVPNSIAEGATHAQVPEQSPFEDPASSDSYQELTPPNPAHARVDSSPPMIPPMRTMSPVGPVGRQSSIIQIASAFPATPTSPTHPAFPAPVANPSSPKSPSFKQAPPLSPAPGAQGQIVSVPPSVHVGRETPVQFGFNDPTTSASAEDGADRRISVVPAPNPKRMSVTSKKSVAKSERPETLYDEEDAYGGI